MCHSREWLCTSFENGLELYFFDSAGKQTNLHGGCLSRNQKAQKNEDSRINGHPGDIHRSHTIYIQRILHTSKYVKTSDRCVTQLANMNIDHEFVELTADVF